MRVKKQGTHSQTHCINEGYVTVSIDFYLKVSIFKLPDAKSVIHIFTSNGINAHDKDVSKVKSLGNLLWIRFPRGTGVKAWQLIEDTLRKGCHLNNNHPKIGANKGRPRMYISTKTKSKCIIFLTLFKEDLSITLH